MQLPPSFHPIMEWNTSYLAPLCASTSGLHVLALSPLPPAAAVGLDCAACLCALTEVYMPALTAAGILPLPANASASSAPALLSESTDVITACTSAFLTPALAAGIDIAGLALLPTQCNYTAGSSKEIYVGWCVGGWRGRHSATSVAAGAGEVMCGGAVWRTLARVAINPWQDQVRHGEGT